MTIKAVFFDMGGTLEKVWSSPEQRMKAIGGLNRLLLSAGIDLGLNEKDLFQVITAGYRHYHDWAISSMKELSPKQVWGEYILSDFPLDLEKLGNISEELMYYLEDNFYQREFRFEVPAVLETLKKMDLKIGLISNICCQDLVPANLDKYGITGFFDPIVLSSVYGMRKPDPSIFQHAVQLAGMSADMCVYVGDRIARDIIGARAAGFAQAYQIINDYDHGEEDAGAVPDAVLNQMTDLLDVLKT